MHWITGAATQHMLRPSKIWKNYTPSNVIGWKQHTFNFGHSTLFVQAFADKFSFYKHLLIKLQTKYISSVRSGL
jgi:hypothetical protein